MISVRITISPRTDSELLLACGKNLAPRLVSADIQVVGAKIVANTVPYGSCRVDVFQAVEPHMELLLAVGDAVG